jgi:hypothetical protein
VGAAAVGGFAGAINYISEWIGDCHDAQDAGEDLPAFDTTEFVVDVTQGALTGLAAGILTATIVAGGNIWAQAITQLANACAIAIVYSAIEAMEGWAWGESAEEVSIDCIYEFMSQFLEKLLRVDAGLLIDPIVTGIDTGTWEEFGEASLDWLYDMDAALDTEPSVPDWYVWWNTHVQPPPYNPISGAWSGYGGGVQGYYYC